MTGKPNRKRGGAEPSPLTRLGIGCRFFRRAMLSYHWFLPFIVPLEFAFSVRLWYREVDHFINLLRNRPDRCGTVVESIDFTDYKALPMDPVNCFEHEQTDYTKYDELVDALQLSALELAILNCYMNGMVQSEVCAELGIGRGRINSRKASIRQRYYSLYGAY